MARTIARTRSQTAFLAQVGEAPEHLILGSTAGSVHDIYELPITGVATSSFGHEVVYVASGSRSWGYCLHPPTDSAASGRESRLFAIRGRIV